MADVIVKNMNMPDGCFFDHEPWHCPFYSALICTQLNTYAASRSSTRLPNCPLRPFPEKPTQTNGDVIRAMTDEQLALVFRMTASCDLCQIQNCKARHYSSPDNCERHWLQWLQSPADGGDGR